MAVAEKVKKMIVEQLGVNESEVVPEAKFIDDLGADSLDIVELVMALEDEYGIEIPDEDAEKIETVGDAIRYIEEHIKIEHEVTVEKKGRRNRFRPRHPLGVGLDNVWEKIVAGRVGGRPHNEVRCVARTTRRSPARCRTSSRRTSYRPKEVRRMDLFIQYALAATKVAVEDAGLDMAKEDAERVGVIVGTGLGGLPTLEKYHRSFLKGAGPHLPLLHPHADSERGARATSRYSTA